MAVQGHDRQQTVAVLRNKHQLLGLARQCTLWQVSFCIRLYCTCNPAFTSFSVTGTCELYKPPGCGNVIDTIRAPYTLPFYLVL